MAAVRWLAVSLALVAALVTIGYFCVGVYYLATAVLSPVAMDALGGALVLWGACCFLLGMMLMHPRDRYSERVHDWIYRRRS